MYKLDVGVDDGIFVDYCFVIEDGCVGVNYDIVFEFGVMLYVFDGMVLVIDDEGFCVEGDVLVDFDVVVDVCGFVDDDVCVVIDEKVCVDLCVGMDIGVCVFVGVFG